ncbi:hypothetical protein FOA52_016322 [Chlamydomonas sp. UWO 241]|nr:hypothetical protein FOA52_016322 [Chlamydomonas sp. UWO 241]
MSQDVISTPRVWVWPLLAFVSLLLAVELSIYYAAANAMSLQTIQVSNMLHASQQWLENELLSTQNGLLSMRAAVEISEGHVADLNRHWASIQTPLETGAVRHEGVNEVSSGWSDRVSSFLLPLGFVMATWPTTYLAPFLNFDLIAESVEQQTPWKAICCSLPMQPTNTPILAGPFRLDPDPAGPSAFGMAMAVYLPNNGTPTAWGMDERHRVPYLEQELYLGGTTGDSRREPLRRNLLTKPSRMCLASHVSQFLAIRLSLPSTAHETNGNVFWGFIGVTVESSLVSDILRSQEQNGLKLALFRMKDVSTVVFGAARTQIFPVEDGPLIEYEMCNDIKLLDVEWKLCVAHWAGFDNEWKEPLMIAMPFILLLLCFLLLLVFYLAESRRRMLRAMLPRKVVDELALGLTYAEMFSGVTVVFADIVSYTALSSDLSPHEVVALLACIFAAFDDMVDRHKLHKAGTVGDAYIVMGGAPEVDDPQDAAIRCARCALEMIEFVGRRTFFPGGKPYMIEIRVGMNTASPMASCQMRKLASRPSPPRAMGTRSKTLKDLNNLNLMALGAGMAAIAADAAAAAAEGGVGGEESMEGVMVVAGTSSPRACLLTPGRGTRGATNAEEPRSAMSSPVRAPADHDEMHMGIPPPDPSAAMHRGIRELLREEFAEQSDLIREEFSRGMAALAARVTETEARVAGVIASVATLDARIRRKFAQADVAFGPLLRLVPELSVAKDGVAKLDARMGRMEKHERLALAQFHVDQGKSREMAAKVAALTEQARVMFANDHKSKVVFTVANEGHAAFIRARMLLPRCTANANAYIVAFTETGHSGDLMTAVISNKVPVMTIIGDTVNVAARMQTNARAQGLHISESTAELLRASLEFTLQPRGCMDIKGKGQMTTYYVAHTTECPLVPEGSNRPLEWGDFEPCGSGASTTWAAGPRARARRASSASHNDAVSHTDAFNTLWDSAVVPRPAPPPPQHRAAAHDVSVPLAVFGRHDDLERLCAHGCGRGAAYARPPSGSFDLAREQARERAAIERYGTTPEGKLSFRLAPPLPPLPPPPPAVKTAGSSSFMFPASASSASLDLARERAAAEWYGTTPGGTLSFGQAPPPPPPPLSPAVYKPAGSSSYTRPASASSVSLDLARERAAAEWYRVSPALGLTFDAAAAAVTSGGGGSPHAALAPLPPRRCDLPCSDAGALGLVILSEVLLPRLSVTVAPRAAGLSVADDEKGHRVRGQTPHAAQRIIHTYTSVSGSQPATR